MAIPIYQVDAFTSELFKGNPAGVCVLPEKRPEEWMQAVAAEMNLSETAFLVRRDNEENSFDVRYFTPTVEVSLCGHATLASAFALWEEKHADSDNPIVFHAPKDQLTAGREGAEILLDFPTIKFADTEDPSELQGAFGESPTRICDSQLPGFLLEFADAGTVREMDPNLAQIAKSKYGACIVTARGDTEGCDFVSRFFAPGLGINEDPVTGSAHCVLGPYWAEQLGKTDLIAHQVSKRGGVLGVRLRKDRVHLLGQAVMVFRGELA